MSNGDTAPAPFVPPPLAGPRLIITMIVTAFANLLATLDLTIANVSIPNIASGLGVSPHEGTWVITSYAVAEAITVPLTGWIAQRFGPSRAFVIAVLGFGLTSAMCGLSTSFPMLITFRVLQGLAGGPLIPLAQTILMSLFPREKVGSALGIWSMTAVLGPVLGPILGGQICDHFHWSWIFLINVPFALMIAFFCSTLLAGRDPPPQRNPVDIVGLSLMILWIGAIQVMLDRGQELDWFGSPVIVGLGILGIIGFIAFLIWELTDPHPIVNLKIFRHRSLLTATIVICIGFGAYFGSVVITPLWLQTNMGYTSAWAGLVNAPPGAAVFCMTPIVAWLSMRMDTRILISFGLAVFALSFLWRAHFASNVTFELLIVNQILNGICISLLMGPAMGIALSAVQPQEIASAAGLVSFFRTTALAFTTSLSTTHWQDAIERSRVTIVDRFQDTNGLDQLVAAGLGPSQALSHLDGMVQDQAVMLATNDIYFMFAGAMAVGSLYIWFAPRMRPRGGGATLAH